MEGYRTPPDEIVVLADAPPTPGVSLQPTAEWLLLFERPPLPPLEEVAAAELRLAGLRINPRTHGPSRGAPATSLRLRRVEDLHEVPVRGLPEAALIDTVRWSPDGRSLAISVVAEGGSELWVCSVEEARARRLLERRLNSAAGRPFVWVSDSRRLICRTLPAGPGSAPEDPLVPPGPVVQESAGKRAAGRTYQDMLRGPHDAELFEYFMAVQIVCVDLEGGVTELGEPGLFRRAEPSPDGTALLVERLIRPFSYVFPATRFPQITEVWDAADRPLRRLADLPLAEDVPIAFDAVRAGPRAFGWRDDRPATLYWVEAADGGDPAVETELRDRLLALDAPFEGEARELVGLERRYAGIQWGGPDLALVHERWWKTRRHRVWALEPDAPGTEARLLFDRSTEDRYGDPGRALTQPTPLGTSLLVRSEDGKSIFLSGAGASPEGDRPFVDRLLLETGETTRLWRSEPPHYSAPIALLDDPPGRLLISREAEAEPPNYLLAHLASGATRALTEFPDPTPQLRGVQKELIKYPRDDGVELTANLYLPKGWSPDDGPLPTLLWAYPREFKDAGAASQVRDSPHRFVRVLPGSPLLWLVRGYAILDGPSMPIVGEGETEANDRYVEQLVASARAAVDELVRRGVAERGRIAVGGHSYGAFMTANLLAHTDLFCAGIARSGAYNRTLTPFGFQMEERTYWEAPEVYNAMSPFAHADSITAPLLLIHGEADNNPGTFPLQSERFYAALAGHGATVRLVLLPHESHGYRARESVLHMLAEMTDWLDRYVRRAE